MQLCTNCPRRAHCKALCPRAEAYVAQDDPIEAWDDITPTDSIEAYEAKMPNGLSTCEAMLQNYFLDRMEVKEIAQHYGFSRQYVYRTISKYKTIIKENIRKSVESG